MRVTKGVLDDLAKLELSALIHLPHNLVPNRTINKVAPKIPQIACFDTAFHRGPIAYRPSLAHRGRRASIRISRPILRISGGSDDQRHSAFVVCQTLTPHMKRKGAGATVNVMSVILSGGWLSRLFFAPGRRSSVREIGSARTSDPGRYYGSCDAKGLALAAFAKPKEHEQGGQGLGRICPHETPRSRHPEELIGSRRRTTADDELDSALVFSRPKASLFTGQDFAPQISCAYSRIVRSLENLPEAATLRMTFRVHSSGLR